uniref:TNCP22a n=2 Tax=Pseudomonadota TaxID=1224 RepID=Q6X3F9_PSEAI|nr:TNCP22a [Pseudomonas aeruginosa]AJW29855.1 hypothetical protein pLM16A1_p13 [Achromobacter sp. LM16]
MLCALPVDQAQAFQARAYAVALMQQLDVLPVGKDQHAAGQDERGQRYAEGDAIFRYTGFCPAGNIGSSHDFTSMSGGLWSGVQVGCRLPGHRFLAAETAGLLPVACRLLLEPLGDFPRPGLLHLVAALVVAVQFLCQRLCLLAVDLVAVDALLCAVLVLRVQLEALGLLGLRLLGLDVLRCQRGRLAVPL